MTDFNDIVILLGDLFTIDKSEKETMTSRKFYEEVAMSVWLPFVSSAIG